MGGAGGQLTPAKPQARGDAVWRGRLLKTPPGMGNPCRVYKDDARKRKLTGIQRMRNTPVTYSPQILCHCSAYSVTLAVQRETREVCLHGGPAGPRVHTVITTSSAAPHATAYCLPSAGGGVGGVPLQTPRPYLRPIPPPGFESRLPHRLPAHG